jgi:hypothetical protein
VMSSSISIREKGWGAHYLKQLQTKNPELFDNLDWRGVDSEIRNEIIPFNDRFGKLDPPTAYLVSTAKIRKWRRFGKQDQQYILSKEQEVDSKPKSRSRRSREQQTQTALASPARAPVTDPHNTVSSAAAASEFTPSPYSPPHGPPAVIMSTGYYENDGRPLIRSSRAMD